MAYWKVWTPPLVSQRKITIGDQAVLKTGSRKRFGSMIHGDCLRPVRKRSSIPDIETVFSESDDRDNVLEKERKEVERVKKSDSIKRAITDIYRTAKLLHNFSILVSPYIHRNLECVSYLQLFYQWLSLLGRIIQDSPRSQRSGTENFPSIKASSKEKMWRREADWAARFKNGVLYHFIFWTAFFIIRHINLWLIVCLCTGKNVFDMVLSRRHFRGSGPDASQKVWNFDWKCCQSSQNETKLTSHLAFHIGNRGDGLLMDWIQLRLGYRLGMCTILALWVAWDCVWGVVEKGQVSIAGRTAFPVFRGRFGLVAWHWFWGMSVYVWTRYRINYIYLFKFDPRNVDTPIAIFNEAADELLVFLVCMLLYYKLNNMKFIFDHDRIICLSRFCLSCSTTCQLGGCWWYARVDATPCISHVPHPVHHQKRIFSLGKEKDALACHQTSYHRTLRIAYILLNLCWRCVHQYSEGEGLSRLAVRLTFFSSHTGCKLSHLTLPGMLTFWLYRRWTICFVGLGDFLLLVADHKEGYANVWTEQFWYKNVAIPLTCLFPLWLRLNQCLRKYGDTGNRMPHLANAAKYAMSTAVSLFGAFHPLYLMQRGHAHVDSQGGGIVMESSRYEGKMFQYFWFGLFISLSLYSFCWDVYMGESIVAER